MTIISFFKMNSFSINWEVLVEAAIVQKNCDQD